MRGDDDELNIHQCSGTHGSEDGGGARMILDSAGVESGLICLRIILHKYARVESELNSARINSPRIKINFLESN